MTECPSAATLARLGVDLPGAGSVPTLEGHIADCPDCQAALDRLLRNDGLASAVSPSPTLPEGDDWPTLPGFVIERVLGRGSMSVVYLARQPSLARLVALKVVRSGPAAGSRDYVHWLREGRSFSLLRHENVVRLHDVGEAAGWLYLVLEYVPGGTLNERLDVPYSARDAARLLADIAEAVEAIHRAGLLHLDLKPSNILMDGPPGAPRERSVPRVGDFGLAYLRDDPEATVNAIGATGPVGTPRYMAPEQVDAGRDPLTPATDVYGLGALFYHVITGRPPFVAPSVAETLGQVLGQDPVPPRRLNPAIPRDLETICLTCLRKEPSQRYATARAVADDLRRFLVGAAIAARPASPAERTWRWCRRRPAVASLAAGLASALAGGFLGMFLLWRHAEAMRSRAETAQASAEAEFARASAVLGQLIELNAGVAGNLPREPGIDRRIDLLRTARRNLVELADRLPDRQAMFSQLMSVDRRLGDLLREESRWEEARDLHETSVHDAEEAVRQFPGAGFARDWLLNSIQRLGETADHLGRPADRLAMMRRALDYSEALYRENPGTSTLAGLLGGRADLARLLAAQQPDEARALLLANRRALEDLRPESLGEETMAARALEPTIWRHLGLVPPPRTRGGGDATLAAADALATERADRLPGEEWARLAICAMGFDDPHRPHGFREGRAAEWFINWAMLIASDERNRGQLDRAVRTADHFVAFARLLGDRNPRDSRPQLVLADSLEQIGKNAWRVADRATIFRSLRQAIEANRRALELAPGDEVARDRLERRQRKLDKLLHPPATAQAGPGPVR